MSSDPIRRCTFHGVFWGLVFMAPGLVCASPQPPETIAMGSGQARGTEVHPEPELPCGGSCEHPVDGVQVVSGEGVRFRGQGGDALLHVWERAQLRYSWARADQPGTDRRQVVEIRRASLFLEGHVFGRHNRYFTQFVFAPRDVGLATPGAANSPIFDMFFTFDYARDLSLRVGQYKPFFSRQFIAAWGDLQFVDRAQVQGEFHLERDLGFDVFSADLGGVGLFRYYAGVYAGQGRNTVTEEPVRFSTVFRFEVLPFGPFDDYKEVDLDRTPSPKLSVGAAYAFLYDAPNSRGVHGPRPADLGTTDIHTMAADFMFKFRGLSATGELYLRHGDRHRGEGVDDAGAGLATDPPRNGWGYFVQAGYLLPWVPIEIAARGGQQHALGSSSLSRQEELGAALGYYPGRHALKLQLDYAHYWHEDLATAEEDQVRVQLQMQM